MSIDNLYTSHVLADRLQRARREASDRARAVQQTRTAPEDSALWTRLRRAVRRVP